MPWTAKARSLDILVQPRRDRKARRSRAQFSGSEAFAPMRSSADSTTITSESRFSVQDNRLRHEALVAKLGEEEENHAGTSRVLRRPSRGRNAGALSVRRAWLLVLPHGISRHPPRARPNLSHLLSS